MTNIIDQLLDAEEELVENEDGDFGFAGVERPDLDKLSLMADLNPDTFYMNLAEALRKENRDQLGKTILASIEEDKTSCKEVLESYDKMKKYLGLNIEEELTIPFKSASGVFDTTMSNAMFSFCSQAKAELLPQKGPCVVQTIGEESQNIVDAAERLETFFNYYLLTQDTGYVPDFEKMLLYVSLYGSCFKKIYYDTSSSMPIARMIKPKDLIIHNDATSIEEAPRITHSFCLTEKEFLVRIQSEIYSNIFINDDYEGSQEDKHSYSIYECHLDLSLIDFFPSQPRTKENLSIPRPYIISLLHDGTILSIRRNYKMGDDSYSRINYFIHYHFFPGFGLYGYGLGHLLGSNSIFMTNIKRHILNSEAMKIYPRGVKMQGVDPKNKTSILQGPGEFFEFDTKGKPIGDVLTYLEPPPQSGLLVDLLREMKQEMSELSSICNVAVPEGSFDAPVGTIMAVLDKQSKVTSSIIQGLHSSLTKEFALIYDMFKGNLQNPFNFLIPGKSVEIFPNDFEMSLRLTPSSDGGVSSFAQNVIKSEALLKFAQSNPQIHDLRAAYYNMYKAIKVHNIDEILPPEQESKGPPPIDPNQVLMIDTQNKFEVEMMKHDKDMLNLAIQKTKILQDYAIKYQQMVLNAQKSGITPQEPVPVPVPDIPLPGRNEPSPMPEQYQQSYESEQPNEPYAQEYEEPQEQYEPNVDQGD